MSEKTYETHPSWGMVGIYRTQGGGKRQLFGSVLSDHHSTVHLRICRGERKHDLGRDWFSGREEIIDVELSAAQFAEFITTPNVGSGVPCTIRSLNRAQVEPAPPAKIEADRVQDYFRDTMQDIKKRMNDLVTNVNDTLDKKTLSVKDKDSIRKDIAMLFQRLTSDLPFVSEQFQEAADKVVSATKAEVDAFMTGAIHRAGLETIAKTGIPGVAVPQKALPEAVEDVPVVPDWGCYRSLSSGHEAEIKKLGLAMANGKQTENQLLEYLGEHARWMNVDDNPGLRGESCIKVAATDYALRLREHAVKKGG